MSITLQQQPNKAIKSPISSDQHISADHHMSLARLSKPRRDSLEFKVPLSPASTTSCNNDEEPQIVHKQRRGAIVSFGKPQNVSGNGEMNGCTEDTNDMSVADAGAKLHVVSRDEPRIAWNPSFLASSQNSSVSLGNMDASQRDTLRDRTPACYVSVATARRLSTTSADPNGVALKTSFIRSPSDPSIDKGWMHKCVALERKTNSNSSLWMTET